MYLAEAWWRTVERWTAFDGPHFDELLRRECNPWYWLCGAYLPLRTVRGQILFFLLLLLGYPSLAVHSLLTAVSAVALYPADMVLSCLMGYITATSLWAITVLYSQHFGRPNFGRVLEPVTRNFFAYRLEVEADCVKVKAFQILVHNNFHYIPMACCFSCSVYLLTRVSSGSYSDLSGVQTRVLIPGYYPFEIRSLYLSIVVSVLQVFHTLYTYTVAFWALFFFLNFSLHWIYQMQRLIDSVRAIEKRALHLFGPGFSLYSEPGDLTSMYSNKSFVSCYLQCLNENILHHQRLVRFQSEFLQSTSLPLGTIYSLVSVMIAILILLTVSGEYDTMAMTLSLMGSLLGSLVGSASIGQLYIDMTEELEQALFETKWYLNKHISQVVRIMMEVTKRPKRPVVWGFIHFDRPGIIAICSAGYSYYNFLHLMGKMNLQNKLAEFL